MDRPVLLGDKSADFLLALDDQAQSDGLDASGGKAAADFVPEQRRNFVTDDAIEHAAGLLRVHQVLVDLGGVLEGSLDSFLRDFVEHHAIDFRRRTVRLGRLFLGGGLGGFSSPSFSSCTTKSAYFLGLPRISARWAQMASPSRSGSPAR